MKELLIYKNSDQAQIPKRNGEFDAGLDLFCVESVFIPYGTTTVVKTDISAYIHPGYVGIVFDRSGMGKKGLSVAGGVIDAGYSGSIDVILHNLTCKEHSDFTGQLGYQIEKGDRIAQLLIFECTLPKPQETNVLWTSQRGKKGFSSSGR